MAIFNKAFYDDKDVTSFSRQYGTVVSIIYTKITFGQDRYAVIGQTEFSADAVGNLIVARRQYF